MTDLRSCSSCSVSACSKCIHDTGEEFECSGCQVNEECKICHSERRGMLLKGSGRNQVVHLICSESSKDRARQLCCVCGVSSKGMTPCAGCDRFYHISCAPMCITLVSKTEIQCPCSESMPFDMLEDDATSEVVSSEGENISEDSGYSSSSAEGDSSDDESFEFSDDENTELSVDGETVKLYEMRKVCPDAVTNHHGFTKKRAYNASEKVRAALVSDIENTVADLNGEILDEIVEFLLEQPEDSSDTIVAIVNIGSQVPLRANLVNRLTDKVYENSEAVAIVNAMHRDPQKALGAIFQQLCRSDEEDGITTRKMKCGPPKRLGSVNNMIQEITDLEQDIIVIIEDADQLPVSLLSQLEFMLSRVHGQISMLWIISTPVDTFKTININLDSLFYKTWICEPSLTQVSVLLKDIFYRLPIQLGPKTLKFLFQQFEWNTGSADTFVQSVGYLVLRHFHNNPLAYLWTEFLEKTPLSLSSEEVNDLKPVSAHELMDGFRLVSSKKVSWFQAISLIANTFSMFKVKGTEGEVLVDESWIGLYDLIENDHRAFILRIQALTQRISSAGVPKSLLNLWCQSLGKVDEMSEFYERADMIWNSLTKQDKSRFVEQVNVAPVVVVGRSSAKKRKNLLKPMTTLNFDNNASLTQQFFDLLNDFIKYGPFPFSF